MFSLDRFWVSFFFWTNCILPSMFSALSFGYLALCRKEAVQGVGIVGPRHPVKNCRA